MHRKKLALLLALLLPQAAIAQALRVSSCEEAGVQLNSVTQMRVFANGGIKMFAADQVEPAAASFGVAVAVDRGADLSSAESFCRYVSGLSGVDLGKMKASFDQNANALTVEGPVQVSDGEGRFPTRTLTLTVNKGAKEAAMVRATLK